MHDIFGVLRRSGLHDWGICAFEQVQDSLLECRAKSRIPENARSVLMTVFPYFIQCGEHNISRYAIPPDYHTIAGEYLNRACGLLREAFPQQEFVWFADNSPIPEVRAAALAGLGCVGLNGLLITPEYGSWVFLGEIVTTLALPESGAEIRPCIRCGKCRGSCPGGAIGADGVETDHCISHISQKKRDLAPWECDLIRKSGSAWGCDICQEICPMNRGAAETYLPEFRTGLFPMIHPGESARLENRAFHWRGPKVIERNLDLLNNES